MEMLVFPLTIRSMCGLKVLGALLENLETCKESWMVSTSWQTVQSDKFSTFHFRWRCWAAHVRRMVSCERLSRTACVSSVERDNHLVYQNTMSLLQTSSSCSVLKNKNYSFCALSLLLKTSLKSTFFSQQHYCSDTLTHCWYFTSQSLW